PDTTISSCDLPGSVLFSAIRANLAGCFCTADAPRRRGGSGCRPPCWPAVLLLQAGFPGIGNWMADEILWQAGLHPRRPAGKLRPAERKKLHCTVKSVSRTALRTVGVDYGELPRTWLFERRWKRGGRCPKDGAALRYAAIGGRTTCWCPKCQKEDFHANVADIQPERAYAIIWKEP